MTAPQVISVRLHSKGRLPEVQTMRRHTTAVLPRSAVKLTPTVWYMPLKEGVAQAQVFTIHQGHTYFLHARVWNANGCIEPRIEVLS